MSGGVDALVLDAFLDGMCDQAARIAGVHAEPLGVLLRQRLALGARRYGPHAYRGRDNLRELREEAADLVAYALFEHLNDLADPLDTDPQRTHHLFMAAVYAAIADAHARAAATAA